MEIKLNDEEILVRYYSNVKRVLNGLITVTQGTLPWNREFDKTISNVVCLEPQKGDDIKGFAAKMAELRKQMPKELDNVYGIIDEMVVPIKSDYSENILVKIFEVEKGIKEHNNYNVMWVRKGEEEYQYSNCEEVKNVELLICANPSNGVFSAKDFAQELIELKSGKFKEQEFILGRFNGKLLVVDNNSTAESIYKQFRDIDVVTNVTYYSSGKRDKRRALQRQAKAREMNEKAKQEKAELEQKREKIQQSKDKMVKNLTDYKQKNAEKIEEYKSTLEIFKKDKSIFRKIRMEKEAAEQAEREKTIEIKSISGEVRVRYQTYNEQVLDGFLKVIKGCFPYEKKYDIKASDIVCLEPHKGDNIKGFAAKTAELRQQMPKDLNYVYGIIEDIVIPVRSDYSAYMLEKVFESIKLIKEKDYYKVKWIQYGDKNLNEVRERVDEKVTCAKPSPGVMWIKDFVIELIELKRRVFKEQEFIYGIFNNNILVVDNKSSTELLERQFKNIDRALSLVDYSSNRLK